MLREKSAFDVLLADISDARCDTVVIELYRRDPSSGIGVIVTGKYSLFIYLGWKAEETPIIGRNLLCYSLQI